MVASGEDPELARGPNGMSLEAVGWGFRMLAGRDPLNDAEVRAFQAMPNLAGLRRTLANTHEFHASFGALFTPHEAWTMPLFLLRPPETMGLEWEFRPPDLARPGSQFCTATQFADPTFAEISEALGLQAKPNRTTWEHVWILSVLANEGMIVTGRSGLGFATGPTRIASLLASRGVSVLACGPASPRNNDADRLDLFQPEIVCIEDFDQLVAFLDLQLTDAATLPGASFDFCWSMGAPDRLGSVEAALDFFEASLVPLRPGGIAAHSFTLNLSSNDLTWAEPGNVLMRRSDIETLAARLGAAGHKLLPLNTHPGAELDDEKVQSAILSQPGLRQRRGMMVSTSFGLAIRKAA